MEDSNMDEQECCKQESSKQICGSREITSIELLQDKIGHLRTEAERLEKLLIALPRELPHQADKALKSLLLK